MKFSFSGAAFLLNSYAMGVGLACLSLWLAMLQHLCM